MPERMSRDRIQSSSGGHYASRTDCQSTIYNPRRWKIPAREKVIILSLGYFPALGGSYYQLEISSTVEHDGQYHEIGIGPESYK